MAQDVDSQELQEQYDLGRRSLRARMSDNWTGYLLVFPIFVLFTALFYFPMVRGIYITFTNAQLGGGGAELVGIDNYVWLITNDLFLFSLGWTIVFVFSTTFLQLTIGLFAALLLNELRTGYREWMSAVIMSPYFSAALAGGVIWSWFLNSSYGMLPRVATMFFDTTPSFLAEGIWPYVSLIVAQSWHDYAYAGIIYLAALTSIPKDQYEAAALSGAGRLRRFRDVTLPHLLTPTIIILALRTAWNIAEFAQPFELTGGGPGTRTMLLSILTYRTAYVNFAFGRAYTIGIVMIILSMAAAIFYITVVQEEEQLYL